MYECVCVCVCVLCASQNQWHEAVFFVCRSGNLALAFDVLNEQLSSLLRSPATVSGDARGLFTTVALADAVMRCDAMRCDAMRCDAMRCDAMRCDAMRCDAMLCDLTRCR
jgi:pentapeptide MXKDX repeat protein